MSCGIYKITNKLNGHSYIGLSINIEKRFADHKTKAFNSNRQDDIDKALYRALRKYGLENFDFDILEECLPDDLRNREIFWIDYFNTYNDRSHYNETPGGDLPGFNTIHLGEDHGMSKLTEQEVLFCRDEYSKGSRSRDVWSSHFADKVKYSGFLGMWHGRTWKHVKYEVFQNNPHRAKYSAIDRDLLVAAWEESGLTINKFVKTPECYVGYGTLYKMVHEPEFYDNK